MSKECREAGLGRVFFNYAGGESRGKREEKIERGRFVPEARDHARLLPRLVDAPRRVR